ncbi:right-handed parallel beta-helix repeat-containing protein [Salinispora mooreana]|uniref:right-handed parallel beta-helix repeat-containing protein n=2 Tax=Salinispora mooreana TaxID=999545 RepID=UPI00037E89AE|nr:right-handed parallel beta-helix repeat-containing protein [Salinispora mooreana]
MTGLALTTTVGIAATPTAASTVAAPGTQAPADSHRDEGKGGHTRSGKGKEQPKGTPVPCDADALIAAITLANARGGATLNLAKGCTYLLTTDIDSNGLPIITTPITLNGHTHTTIERAAAADPFRILTVNTGGDLTLNKIKITGGQTAPGAPGGGILVNLGGELTAKHSEIVRNIATFGVGGGVANRGTTTVKGSTVSRNTSRQGGGIFNTGRLTAGKVMFADNGVTGFGGGISSTSSGTAEVSDSTFTRNRALGGAGIGDSSGAITTVVGSTFTDNSATALGGGIFIDGQLTLRKVTIANNTAPTQGAGVVIQNSMGGSSAVIEDSKISNNTTAGGGGGIINVFAPLVLRDTKIEGNQADTGGGLLNLFNSTSTLFNTAVVKNIAVNDGGGIFNDPTGVVVLNSFTGTVVIKNRPNNCVNVPDCAG